MSNDILRKIEAERESLIAKRVEIDQRLKDLDVLLRTLPDFLDAAGTTTPSGFAAEEHHSVGSLLATFARSTTLTGTHLYHHKPKRTWTTTFRTASTERASASEIAGKCREAILEANDYVQVWTLVEILSNQGLELGDTEDEKQRRVSTVLSRSDGFVAKRGQGWGLAPKTGMAPPFSNDSHSG